VVAEGKRWIDPGAGRGENGNQRVRRTAAARIARPARKRLAAGFDGVDKFRLSVLVVVTAMVGYLAGCGLQPEWGVAVHALVGTACAAFGAAIFNQLMEIGPDALMQRTRDRPLPARRMSPALAFVLGWVVSAFGILHLAGTVQPENPQPAYLAAATLGLYVFAYTPMKRLSGMNTVVGAVTGALPPVIGWTAAGRGYDTGAAILFGILFFWQLPHFVAINWMYREEYETAGFAMWSNGDLDGRRSALLCIVFSLALAACCLWPWAAGLAGPGQAVAALVLGGWLTWLSVRFWRERTRAAARRVFLFTLLFLPLSLGALLVFWRG
jgi:heme o synthase